MITKWSQYSTSTIKKTATKRCSQFLKIKKKAVIDTETAIRRCSTK